MKNNILRENFISLFRWGLYATCFTLPLLLPHFHGKVIAFTALMWLCSLGFQPMQPGWWKNNMFLSAIVTLLLALVGMLYSENVAQGWARLETLAPLVALPLMILGGQQYLSGNALKKALIFFVAGVITLNLASLGFISRDLWDFRNLQANLILANNSIVKIHPAYLSLYISFSIFFIVDQYFPMDTGNRSKVGWILFGLAVLVAFLVWLNSRVGVLSFFVAAIFYILYRYTGKTRGIGFAALSGILILILIIPFSRHRFVTAPLEVLTGSVAPSNTADPDVFPLQARKGIAISSVELLQGSAAFVGYGTGDGRDKLLQQYREDGRNDLADADLDAHNEYFAIWHRHGIAGLVVMLFMFGSTLTYAMRQNSALLAVFVVLYAMIAALECAFSAQKGLTFFALLTPLLMLHAGRKATV